MSQEMQHSGIDIGRQQIGSIYAKGFLNASEKSGDTEKLLDELDALVTGVLDRHPDMEATLGSPRLSPAEKIGLLDRVFGGKVSDGLLTFLKVICQHGRLDCLREIQSEARKEFNRLKNVMEITVTTAQPIDSKLERSIESQLSESTGRRVDLICQIDPNLIGGMVVRIGDQVYDSSVANKLGRIREEAVEKTMQQFRDSIDNYVAG